ncbi:GMC family oxidoreductase [Pikeienuella piscinae]|uniref:GMC family oxidoreductase n=1 Tax=Pikeienuella piscinae TaxID=2748098 RepID=A0A7L5BZP0_9RHOB|nr:GMC family oxidoreductase [Pikeienuella piscinae]QIE56308.1 GMC family oxidoreductase [Pikeienuella piscinae]
MSEMHYDAVIVGAGISGALIAKQLAAKGRNVLILEAGADGGAEASTYRSYVDAYHLTEVKVPNSPYPANPSAPSPSVLDVGPIAPGRPDTAGYFVQNGPNPFRSNYTRVTGGTMMHWLGTCLRMQPNDFRTRSAYGQGVDWPLSYDDLAPWYERAEWEIGVSGDKSENEFGGIHFSKDYDFPMEPIPKSFSDRWFEEGVRGMEVALPNGETKTLSVSTTPQGRNSTPRKGSYKVGGEKQPPYGAAGATGAYAFQGQRCEGNSSCVPICPIQAKYNALKTLSQALRQKGRVEIRSQSVVSKIETDGATGRVTGVVYKRYEFPGAPAWEMKRVTADAYVLATNAIENAKLALASGLCPTSGQLGRNLMDHPYVMVWGRAPRPVGPFRGPGSTASFPDFRDGGFRTKKAAVRLELANWGWNFAANAPYSDVARLVEGEYLFGPELRARLRDEVQHQVRIGIMPEQLPSALNRVSVNPAYRDSLGEPRPVLDYAVDAYSRAGVLQGMDICQQIFQRLGIENRSTYDPNDPGYVSEAGRGFVYFGAGHNAGTHRIGASRHDSVTDLDGRSWDHDNLWLVGCGAMPTIATSNPTLTMTALVLKAAAGLERALEGKS